MGYMLKGDRIKYRRIGSERSFTGTISEVKTVLGKVIYYRVDCDHKKGFHTVMPKDAVIMRDD